MLKNDNVHGVWNIFLGKERMAGNHAYFTTLNLSIWLILFCGAKSIYG